MSVDSKDPFDGYFQKLLKTEGGYVNNKNDRGGKTKFGITLNTLKSVNPKATEKDLRGLSKEQAKKIYKDEFYLRYRINELPAYIREQVFDIAVNSGPGTAIKLIQELAGVKQDGVIGPNTIKAASLVTNNKLADRRQQLYNAIVEKDPTQEEFIDGWTNRANSFRDKEMTQEGPTSESTTSTETSLSDADLASMNLDSDLLGQYYDMGNSRTESRVSNLIEQQKVRDKLKQNQLDLAVAGGEGKTFRQQERESLLQDLKRLQKDPLTAPDYNKNILYSGFDYGPAVPPVISTEIPGEQLTVPLENTVQPLSTPPPSLEPSKEDLLYKRNSLLQAPPEFNDGTNKVKYYEDGINFAGLDYDSPVLIKQYDNYLNSLNRGVAPTDVQKAANDRVLLLAKQQENQEEIDLLNKRMAIQAGDSVGAEFNAAQLAQLTHQANVLNSPEFANLPPPPEEALGFDFVPRIIDNNKPREVVQAGLVPPALEEAVSKVSSVPSALPTTTSQLIMSQPPVIETEFDVANQENSSFDINDTMRGVFEPIGEIIQNNPLKDAIRAGRKTMQQEKQLDNFFNQQIVNQSKGVPGGNLPVPKEIPGFDPNNLFNKKPPPSDLLENEIPPITETESEVTSAGSPPVLPEGNFDPGISGDTGFDNGRGLAVTSTGIQFNGKLVATPTLPEERQQIAKQLGQDEKSIGKKITPFLKKWFGIEGEDLSRALGLYLMSRLTGASHEGSMRWAGKTALDTSAKRQALEAKTTLANAEKDKTIEALVDAGYTEASARSYVQTKLDDVLVRSGSRSGALKETGNSVQVGIRGLPGFTYANGYEVEDPSGNKYNVFRVPNSVFRDPKPGFKTVNESQLAQLIANATGGNGRIVPYDKSMDTQEGRTKAAIDFTDGVYKTYVKELFTGADDKVRRQIPTAYSSVARWMQDTMEYKFYEPGIQQEAQVVLLTAMKDMRNDLDSGRISNVDDATPYVKRSILTSAALPTGQLWITADGKNTVSATKTNEIWSKLKSHNSSPAAIKTNFKKLHQTFVRQKKNGDLPSMSLKKSKENEFSVWVMKTLNDKEALEVILSE